MLGTFKEGLVLVPFIEQKLEEYALFLDQHRILVFNYKIATLYFGSGDYQTSIDYLQRIINDQVDLRSDLQCYARLLHLMAHYELGNFELMEPLTKSVYRFMAKMENLTVVEQEMFKFIRKSFHLSRYKVKQALEQFLNTIKHLEKNRFQTRSFAYLDIISWVESKVHQKPMSEVIYKKYITSKRSLVKKTAQAV
jgi:tetratricopeptide (TPR) repeat protein